jgi:hypothetical protein
LFQSVVDGLGAQLGECCGFGGVMVCSREGQVGSPIC